MTFVKTPRIKMRNGRKTFPPFIKILVNKDDCIHVNLKLIIVTVFKTNEHLHRNFLYNWPKLILNKDSHKTNISCNQRHIIELSWSFISTRGVNLSFIVVSSFRSCFWVSIYAIRWHLKTDAFHMLNFAHNIYK